MVCMRSEKPICTPSRFSEVSPMMQMIPQSRRTSEAQGCAKKIKNIYIKRDQDGIYSSDLTKKVLQLRSDWDKMIFKVQIWRRWHLQFRSDQDGIYNSCLTKMASTVQIWPRQYLQFSSVQDGIYSSYQDGIYSLDLTKMVSTVHTKMVSTVQIWPRWYLQFRSDQDGIYSSYQNGIYSSYQNGIYSSDLTKMVSTVQIWPRWYLQFRSDQEGIYAPSKALVHLTPCFYDTVQHSSLKTRVDVLSWTYWSEGGNRSWENRSAFSVRRSQVWRSLRYYLRAQSQGRHTIDRLDDKDTERGNTWRSFLKGRERVIVSQTHIGTVSNATLGKCTRNVVGRIWIFMSA